MNRDIDRFVIDPSLLIELCRDVIDRIDCAPGKANTSEKEAQLREIAKAVEKLEKMGVPVPDTLRGWRRTWVPRPSLSKPCGILQPNSMRSSRA